MSPTIDIDELRVGMFVHLDLGWWAHPFALSSFLVQSPDQIATIRGLGLRQLRWSPERSQLEDSPTAPSSQWAASDWAANDASAADGAGADPAALPEQPVPAADEAPVVVDAGQLAHRRALDAQRESQRLCEQQYGEAGAACLQAFQLAQDTPEECRAISEGLTRSLLDKLMVDREMCVRVLSQGAGDTATAHALNVAVISLLMGRVFGFDELEMLDLGLGALLHDVGKLELPERVRHPGVPPLTASEQALYQDHVAHGVLLGRRMGLAEGAINIVAQHHELADRSGFPQRLGVDRMSAAARIVALVNRYDNLCNPLQAANGLTPHEALSLIFAQCRTQFDASMLNAFIRMMGVYPPGSVVQLTDDRYATVISVNSSRPLKPRVLVCDLGVPVRDALLLNLDNCPDLGIRRSLKANQLPLVVRDYLSPRPRMVYFFEPVALPATEADQVLAA